MGRIDEALMRAALLREMHAELDEELLEAEDAPEEGPFDDLPGVWLDELDAAPEGDAPVVVLCPRVFYADTWSPVLLDDLLFGHRAMGVDYDDDIEA